LNYLDVEGVGVSKPVARKIMSLFGPEIGEIDQNSLRLICEAASKGLINVVSLETYPLTFDNSSLLEASKTKIEEIIDFAKTLKAEIVSFGLANFNRKKVPWEKIVSSCSEVAHCASSRNVKVAIENGEFSSLYNLLKTPRQFKNLCEGVNSSHFGLCLDVSAAATVDFNVARFAKKVQKHVFAVHVNDMTRDLRFKNLIVGSGDIKFRPFFKLFQGRPLRNSRALNYTLKVLHCLKNRSHVMLKHSRISPAHAHHFLAVILKFTTILNLSCWTANGEHRQLFD
jgi:sugar phosphate isomerase/epimerase